VGSGTMDNNDTYIIFLGLIFSYIRFLQVAI